MVALNKIDIVRPEELREDARAALGKFEEEGVLVLPMSTVTEEGITELKTQACDLLLAQRVDMKLKGKKVLDILNRLHVATPTPRDQTERLPFIPPGAKVKTCSGVGRMEVDRGGKGEEDTAVRDDEAAVALRKKLERDIELEMGDDYYLDLKKNYLLASEDERYDDIPEIFEGKTIADYIDPDILQRLEELEREEELKEQAGVYDSEPEDEETLQTRKIAVAIRKKRSFLRKQSWAKKSRNCPVMPRSKGPAVRPSRPRKKRGEERGVEGMELPEDGGDSGSRMEDGEFPSYSL